MKTFLLAALLGLCILLAGCASDSDDGGGDGPNFNFITTIKLKGLNGNEKNLFTQGEPITFELSITNIADSPRILTFGSSQIYEFIVARAGELQPVWHWSFCKGFLTVIQEMSFAEGETKTFQETWDQTNDAGGPVSAGDYVAQGFMRISAEAANDFIGDQTETRSVPVGFIIN